MRSQAPLGQAWQERTERPSRLTGSHSHPSQACDPTEGRKPDVRASGGSLRLTVWVALGEMSPCGPGIPFIPGKVLNGKTCPSKRGPCRVPGKVHRIYALLCFNVPCGHTCSRDCRKLAAGTGNILDVCPHKALGPQVQG